MVLIGHRTFWFKATVVEFLRQRTRVFLLYLVWSSKIDLKVQNTYLDTDGYLLPLLSLLSKQLLAESQYVHTTDKNLSCRKLTCPGLVKKKDLNSLSLTLTVKSTLSCLLLLRLQYIRKKPLKRTWGSTSYVKVQFGVPRICLSVSLPLSPRYIFSVWNTKLDQTRKEEHTELGSQSGMSVISKLGALVSTHFQNNL